MDSIVNKLSDIESVAEAIVEHAEAQKPLIEKEMQEKRDQFDAKLEQDTQEKLLSIRTELKSKTDSILDEQRTKNSDTIDSLLKDFDQNHTKYAQQVLIRITEV